MLKSGWVLDLAVDRNSACLNFDDVRFNAEKCQLMSPHVAAVIEEAPRLHLALLITKAVCGAER